jgi:hypothetical protein
MMSCTPHLKRLSMAYFQPDRCDPHVARISGGSWPAYHTTRTVQDAIDAMVALSGGYGRRLARPPSKRGVDPGCAGSARKAQQAAAPCCRLAATGNRRTQRAIDGGGAQIRAMPILGACARSEPTPKLPAAHAVHRCDRSLAVADGGTGRSAAATLLCSLLT